MKHDREMILKVKIIFFYAKYNNNNKIFETIHMRDTYSIKLEPIWISLAHSISSF